MPATVVYREASEKPDGSRYEMVAWRVPENEEYPEGVKYSLQYMDDDGDTLLRYDNAPHHRDIGRHRRHTHTGEVTKLDFTGLADLITDFQAEVNDIHDRRTN
ncbi:MULTISPECIES: toxin-antitoxin system TumE family protein [Halorubrum]|uniref:Uncharacterized protein n=1 Tax=Halorubrum sodomense TaxID=35743 RepID=A0A1I6FWP7_HALSD|nr:MULTISPECIES: DUF6516 family protein [Halorubrum]TKX83535.1 hypothetical protein EXE43_23750 [Halorubrum sp. SS5]TKX53995.1 hypothetical protein EXE44_17085 [Halorubrum sp. SS7]TKX54270.1 hypothetical protein EXE42_08570 [Halorubrum sp. SP3]TKX69097.1 hypothetical protein EXE45_09355 [Halorubrum sp. SP9]SFR34340.1 hypothetical protein SAMN04487937_1308 [Halorubrum sodomense]